MMGSAFWIALSRNMAIIAILCGMKKQALRRARNTLSALINKVAYRGIRVTLESRGNPKAALVSLEDLEKLKRLDIDGRGTAAARLLVRARSLRERIHARRRENVADSASVVEQLREGRVREFSGMRRR